MGVYLLLTSMAAVVAQSLAAMEPACAGVSSNNIANRPTIVLSVPGPTNTYYATPPDRHTTLINFYAQFACKIMGNDNVVVFCAPGDCDKLIAKGVPENVVIPEELMDIWMRDFSPAGRMINQAAFVYQPNYLTKGVARKVQDSLFLVLEDKDIQYELAAKFKYKSPDLILDGGNVVDNNVDTAILTRRAVKENLWFGGEEAIRAELSRMLGYKRIIFVDEVPDDTTGHSDGMLSFIDDHTLAIQYDNEFIIEDIRRQMGSTLPEIKLINVPEYYEDQTWDGFSSACNVHVNSIVTRDFIYMPHFGIEGDNVVRTLFEENSKKKVIPVHVPKKVCEMGGSVRCLAWQCDGHNADLLIKLPKIYADWEYE